MLTNGSNLFFVSEALPTAEDGGGMRTREMVVLLADAFNLPVLLFPRSHGSANWLLSLWYTDAFYQRQDLRVLTEFGPLTYEDRLKVKRHDLPFYALRRGRGTPNEFPLLQPTTRSYAGRLTDFVDFGAALQGRGAYAYAGSLSISVAVLSMWSFHIAPSGDPFLTIPEIYIPRLRVSAPTTCIVIMADDIQHRRFAIESKLSAASVAKLAERELSIYGAADGIFFASREDQEEVEALLQQRRMQQHDLPRNRSFARRVVASRRREEGASEPAALVAGAKLLAMPYWPVASTKIERRIPSGRPLSAYPYPLLFLGSSTVSNAVALKWLIAEVLPVIRLELPGVTLSVAGGINVSQAIGLGGRDVIDAAGGRDVMDVSAVRSLGFVNEIQTVLESTALLLLPNMIASGTTTKVHLAIQHTVPVITTTNGIRGIWYEDDQLPASCGQSRPIAVHDNPREYAAASVHLLKDLDAYVSVTRCLASFRVTKDQINGQSQQDTLNEMRRHCESTTERRVRLQSSRAATVPRDVPALHAMYLVPEEAAEAAASDSDYTFVHQMAKFASWRGAEDTPHSSYRRGRDLTIIATFSSKDSRYVDTWLKDISAQRALSLFSVELVIGCYQAAAYEFMRAAVSQRLDRLAAMARVNVVLFEKDPGIYGMWNAIVERPSCAPIVTNWNLADRKRPDSLLKRLNTLNANASLGGVTSDVMLFSEPADQASSTFQFTWFKPAPHPLSELPTGHGALACLLAALPRAPGRPCCMLDCPQPCCHCQQLALADGCRAVWLYRCTEVFAGRTHLCTWTPMHMYTYACAQRSLLGRTCTPMHMYTYAHAHLCRCTEVFADVSTLLGEVDLKELPWVSMIGCYAWEAPKIYHGQLLQMKSKTSRALKMIDMFEMNRTRNWTTGRYDDHFIGSKNVPHNSPMWRKSMQQQLGGFHAPPGDRKTCHDFSFWLRALKANFTIWHLTEPLEMFLYRESSLGSTTGSFRSRGSNDEEWFNECDSAEEWEAHRQAASDDADLQQLDDDERLRVFRVRWKRLWWAKRLLWLLLCCGGACIALPRLLLVLPQSQRNHVYVQGYLQFCIRMQLLLLRLRRGKGAGRGATSGAHAL